MAVLAGCTDSTGPVSTDPGPAPLFALEELSTFKEMRDCRHSHEHELRFIRVFADADAQAPYAALSEEVPYPVGCRLVKLEYDDRDCTSLLGYTALKKLPKDSSPRGGDWTWQKLDTQLRVVEHGAPTHCIGCHVEHCAPPNGFDLTCAEEL